MWETHDPADDIHDKYNLEFQGVQDRRNFP
jgi:hypothetical protein